MKTIKKLFLLCLFCMISIGVSAYDFSAKNSSGKTIYYNIISSTDLTCAVTYRTTTSYNSYSGTVNIPASVSYNGKTYSVTRIGNGAFFCCSDLTSIEIPNSVTSIWAEAFCGCTGLTSVTIPNSVTSIGCDAFEGCLSLPVENNLRYADTYLVGVVDKTLSTYTIKEGTKWIGSGTFKGCSGLTSIEIPNSVTIIGEYAFEGSGLTAIEIPNSVTSIGYGAFSCCSGLTSIEIPNSVTSIGYGAFSCCSGLTSIEIPNSVTSIGDEAFSGCNLYSLTIGSGVLSIGGGAFPSVVKTIWMTNTPPSGYANVKSDVNYVSNNLYAKLANVKVYPYLSSIFSAGGIKYAIISPSSRTCDVIDCVYDSTSVEANIGETVVYKNVTLNVLNINDYACYGDACIEKANISNNGYVGAKAFYKCTGLQTLNTSNKGYIGGNAFYGTTSLNNTIVSNTDSVGTSAFENSGVKYLKITNEGDIKDKAFYNCESMKTLSVANNGYIGSTAFYNTTSLDSAVVANKGYVGTSAFENSGVKYLKITNEGDIKDKAFYNCESMKTLSVANNGYIGSSAFYNTTSLDSAVVANKGYIGTSAFENSGVKYLKITNEGDIKGKAFYNCESLKTLSVANNGYIGSFAFYNTTSLDSAVVANKGYVGTSAFENSGVKFLKISNEGWIDYKSFYNTTSLDSAYIANKGYVGESAFENSGVKVVKVQNKGVVDNSAFNNCKNLADVTLGDSITTLGDRAFCGCTSLPKIVIPDSITAMGERIFQDCKALTSVKIGTGIPEIKTYAFSGCSSLPEIEIPQNVKSIGNYTFSGCTSLADVIFEDRATSLTLGSNGANAMFKDCPLDSVYIGGKVKYNTADSYGYSPFYRNTSLRTVVITNEEETVYDNEFYGCTGLKSVSIGDGTTSVGNWAFSDCPNLEYFAFGQKIATIGREAFSDCVGVTKIISNAVVPPVCGEQALDDINKWECELIVPKGHGQDYTQAEQWKEFFFISEAGDEEPVYVTSVTVDESEYLCILGQTGQATATVKPDDATNKTVVWSSSDEEKLTIDANTGEFTGLALGNVTITATSTDGSNISDTCTVTVTAAIVPVTSITLSKEVASIEAGKTLTLTATILPEDATITDLDWTSSNPTVATVDNGVVSGLTEGKTTITATSTDGTNISATCEVTVIEQGSIEPSTDISKYPNIIYFNDIETRAGSELTLPLNMKNAEENITAFQCDVYLPAGMSWASTIDKRGNIVLTQPTFDAETERTDENYHVISPVTQMPDGSYRIIVYSMSMDYILDKDGAILDLPIVVAEDMEAGEYNMFLRNVVMTDVDGQQVLLSEVVSKVTVPSFTPGDVNDDKMINVTDVVAVISHMLGGSPSPFIFKAADVNNDNMINVTDVVGIIKIINTGSSSTVKTIKNIAMVGAKSTPTDKFSLVIEPFTVASGTTSKSVSLNMNNPTEDITAFECNIHLPEGISWSSTVDRRGNVTYDLPTFNATADRTDSRYHTIAPITKMEDGSFKVVVYSMGLEIFLDKSGAILDLPLVFDENLADGIYDITMSDIVLTHTDVTDIHLDEYKLSVLVGSPKEKVLTLHGDFTRQSVTDYNSALAANTDVTTMDLTEAFDIDATATFATANKNLLLYVAEGKSVANKENVIVGNKVAKLILTDGHSFYAPKAFTAESGSYVRKNITTLCSVCLPFELTASDVNGNKIGVLYTNCIDANNGSITFEEVSKVSAGTPCIVNCANKTDWTIDLTNREIISDCDNTTAIKGSYDKHTIGEGFLKVDNEGTGFIHTGSESAVFPFRAYLDVEDADKLSVVRFAWVDGGATYIDSINMDALNDKDVIFDLSGRRVARPMKRMVYLVNGKKVLIK